MKPSEKKVRYLRPVTGGKQRKPQIQIQLNKVFTIRSDDSLPHHCVGHFHESCNVGTFHIIDITVIFSTIFYALGMDVTHDLMEMFVHFFGTPGDMHCVLGHFQTGSRYTACIDKLADWFRT